jgi:hypothetical protein
MRRSSPRIALACIAVSRFTMSLLVDETSAMAPSSPALCRVRSEASPITTGRPRLRANATAGAFWS